MKLYLIAGEASGDLHGSNLLKELQKQHPGVQCRVWGGDMMQAAGGELVKHYRDLAFMGFWEVLKNLKTILGNLRFCKNDILEFKPDAIVLIDYPGFNLRIAKWAKKQGIKVIYYISPQLWAWHSSRAKAIRRDVDKMLVILPFETAFYEKFDHRVEYVGHPLLDVIEPSKNQDSPEKLIALLPGSRTQEVERILPVMLSITPYFPEFNFVIAGAKSLPDSFYAPFLAGHPNVALQKDNTYVILRRAAAALVKSGTSTLETALIGTPQVVCYAGNALSYAIAKRVVNVPYISLVNLILERPLIKELIQEELHTQNLREALTAILQPKQAAVIRTGYQELREKLGDGGASARAARLILEDI